MVEVWPFYPAVYLGYCSINKIIIDKEVKRLISKQHVPASKYFTTSAPCRTGYGSWWPQWQRLLCGFTDRYLIKTTASVFNTSQKMFFVKTTGRQPGNQQLKQFSKGFYTAEQWDDSLGHLMAIFVSAGNRMADPREKFGFHYFLQHPSANKLVVQRLDDLPNGTGL